MSKQAGYRYKEAINESQESESIKAARKLYMQRRGVDETEADRWVRIDLRGDIPALRSKQGGKFIFGVTRMFLDGEIRNAETIEGINTAVQYASSEAHIKEYDRNLNNLSAQEFINKFADMAKADSQADRQARSQEEYLGDSEYQIIPINSFDEALQYRDYTSWCITRYENMYDSYTSNGVAQFYFCLKNGFENIKPIAGHNCPLDEYGLSMIAVCVDKDGRLKTCTCRWNHDKGGNDHVMGTKQISQVINRNFYEVFKPNDKWEMAFQKIKADLKAGKEYHQIFEFVSSPSEGITKVKYAKQWNFLNENREFISETWFDLATDFANGIAGIRIENKWNFINKQGQYISQEWFANISWVGGYDIETKQPISWIPVQKFGDHSWYFMNYDGNFMSDQGWEEIDSFYNGWARVKWKTQFNYINANNELISDEWFVEANPFRNGYACVYSNKRGWNWLSTRGNLILPDHYADYLKNFDKDGYALFRHDGKWGVITNECEVVVEPQYRHIDGENRGVARVENDEGLNNYIYIPTGEILLDKWVSQGRLPRLYKNCIYAEVYWNDNDPYPEDVLLKKMTGSFMSRFRHNENKTIIISERQAELLKEHILNEGLSQIVYHFTSIDSLYGIVINNKFYLKSGIFGGGSDLGGGKRMFYLSTTRNRNAKEGYSFMGKTSVRITLDGEKLAQKYHGQPFNYWGDDSLGRMKYLNPEKVGMPKRWGPGVGRHAEDETEDRVWSYKATIENALSYIKRVDVCIFNENEITELDTRIANMESQGKTELVYALKRKKETLLQENEEMKRKVFDLKRSLKDRLFIYDNDEAFAFGGNGYVNPEWLNDWSNDEGIRDRIANASQHSNFRTQATTKRALAAALAIMVGKMSPKDYRKAIIRFCEQYGFKDLIDNDIFRMVTDYMWRYSNDIAYIASEINPSYNHNREDIAKIQNMLTHWMRKNGYSSLRDIKLFENEEIKKVRQGMIAYEEHEPDYEIGFEGPDASDYAHIISEDVNPEDVDLSSFEIKKKLNPKFWKDNKLDSRVRLKLLDIADDFTDFLNVNWVKPSDITMTGSLANYTWNEEYSDIDLHIILNYKDVDERTDFVKNYFDAKKKEWNEKHKDIKIYGFPVEVYVQNENEPHKSSGVYSLEKNEWVTEPDVNNFSEDDYDKNNVKTKVADFMNKIDGLENDFNTTDDEHQIEIIFDDAESLFNDIKDERKNAFKETDKELSDGNIVFKTLRRNGYIEKISDLKNKTYDKINSLD